MYLGNGVILSDESLTLQIFWLKPGNPREGGQKGGTNGREGGEGGSRAKPGNQLVIYIY